MRAAILNRTGSLSPGRDVSGFCPRSPAGGHDAGISLCRRSKTQRMPLEVRERRSFSSPAGKVNLLRRVRSDTDLIRSAPMSSCGSRWLPPALHPDVKEDGLHARVWKGVSKEVVVVKEDEEVEFSGGSGKGKGRKSMGGSFGDGGNEENDGNRMIDHYYQEMLRADPGNPLLLRNYGRFLHEVERDLKKAEGYYGRAILACPGDGDLFSLYARLIWDSHRDCKRAETYHERAVEASPNDCYVLGSYAHFLWEAEEEGEEEGMVDSSSSSVEAF
ncbi:uncharacterized protein LOC110096052 [Dendrobium catenatum]|uniref:Uncharacterized protein n=1 Tax=Dendrobium catenatum TaxID=906689 RepID=A0A2I0VZ96_9ASPA|nr:uncharacterized protein LOC110096052 [Dendrobium catenatum]PKU68737.1 hypothetical protein MA16_Dca014207 [Dendrobium catenatum]